MLVGWVGWVTATATVFDTRLLPQVAYSVNVVVCVGATT
jgi:hypothetical protein